MQKFKSINLGKIMSYLKCVLIGIVSTLIGIVVFAVVLKFADIPLKAVSYVNDVIKGVSILIMMLCMKKINGERLIVKGVICGSLYAIFSFMVFSIINGKFAFDMSFIYDLLFSIIIAVVMSVIINLLNRKNA